MGSYRHIAPEPETELVPAPRTPPPLPLLIATVGACAATAWLLGMLELDRARLDAHGGMDGAVGALIIAGEMLYCGTALVMGIGALLGERWARTVAAAMAALIVLALGLAIAAGTEHAQTYVAAGAWFVLLVALFLPSTRQHCVRLGGKACRAR